MVNETPSVGLAHQARTRFMAEVVSLLDALPNRVSVTREAAGAAKTAIGAMEAMETEAALRQKSGVWRDAAQRAWRGKAQGFASGKISTGALLGAAGGSLTGITLVDNDEMERSLAAGRLASAIRSQAGQQLSQLRARMQRLEGGGADFAPGDVLRPETFAQALLDAWMDCGFTSAQWRWVQDTLQSYAAQGLGEAYRRTNAFLIEHGVPDEIDLRAKMRRTPDRVTTGWLPSIPGTLSAPGTLYPTSPGGYRTSGPSAMVSGAGTFVYAPPGSAARAQYEAALYSGVPGVAAAGLAAGGPATGAALTAGPVAGGWGGVAPVVVAPLGAWQQQRAQTVLGDLHQFALRHGAALTVGGVAQPISPVLALALAEPASAYSRETQYLTRVTQAQTEMATTVVDDAAGQIRDKAKALKDKAGRADEKAIIEIVSLMFQAILTDERLPLALRVWFGRLQVPVLRVALAEPEFFATPDHPARQLIDCLGACAMGLGGTEVDGRQLEQEIKRVVQMIEQYPEAGKKVFQVALDEFEKFLGSSLTQGQPAQKFATLAQQIEHKDALAIQYTIELRKMLGTVPVSEEVRQFLFRIWAEVLALAAVRHGAQGAETMRLKQAAVDLLWVVSPKADRAERQQITQHLPGILKTLREGMQTLAMQTDEQDGHIRLINQAVMQAFHSPGRQGIMPAQMNQLACALTGLEDVVTDDPEGDLLLDPSLLEQMLGVDGEDLVVIAAGGARPDADNLQRARRLQPGQWFTLRYQGAAPVRARYVWRSARGQLHLFTAVSGQSYLVQTRRLAAYLQAGLIAPVEDDTLTIRATREALNQLGQEPERLLS